MECMCYQHLNVRIITKCNFRFRWVALQLNELKECRTRTDLKRQLADLPEGLEETYDRILLGIKKKDQSYVKLFLQWLSFAVRPLTLMELAATVAVDLSADNGPEYKSDNELQDVQDVLKYIVRFILWSILRRKINSSSCSQLLQCQWTNRKRQPL